MKYIKFLVVFLVCSITIVHAQVQKKTPVKVKTITKYKPPKLITLLSTYKDSAVITAGEAENVISIPLRVVDDKKNIYTISSYQFLYKKNMATENEETGKVSQTTTMFSDRFKTTPLPQAWIIKVRENPRPKEVLYFFDIIVKDAQGRVMYAPEIKFTIQ